MHRHRPACQTTGISRANDTNKILARIGPTRRPPCDGAGIRNACRIDFHHFTTSESDPKAAYGTRAKGEGVAVTRARRAGRRSGHIPLRHESETAYADADDAQLNRRKSTITSDLATAAASKNRYRRRTDKTLPGNESPAATAPKKLPPPRRPPTDSFHPQKPAAGSRFRFHSPTVARWLFENKPTRTADATRTPREVKKFIG